MMALAALAFLSELVALGALAAWGWRTGEGDALRWLLAIGLPVAFALIWGVFLSPRANVTLPPPTVLSLKLTLFLLVSLALWGVSNVGWAALFLLVAVLTTVLPVRLP